MKFNTLFSTRALLPALAPILMLLLVACGGRNQYVSIVGYAQGGSYGVKLNLAGAGADAEELKRGIDSVLLCIDRSLSGYNDSSLISRFNSGERIIPDKIFIDIYKRSREFYAETEGCVDVSAGALFDMWGFGFTSDSLPSRKDVDKVLKNIGMDRLKNEMDPQSVCAADLLLAEGLPPRLNYNAVAQGYSCDLVAEYLISQGVKDMLIDIGGEIFCQGHNPAGQKWTIGIDKPQDGNNVPGQSLQGIFEAGPEPMGVVTSGNYRKFYVKDGKKYAHTIDPRTGYPVSHSLLSATIIADNAAEADALATYCMVIGLEEAQKFITSRPDLEACLVYDDDGEFRTWTSPGFALKQSLTR